MGEVGIWGREARGEVMRVEEEKKRIKKIAIKTLEKQLQLLSKRSQRTKNITALSHLTATMLGVITYLQSLSEDVLLPKYQARLE